jgi:hypothetical protein
MSAATTVAAASWPWRSLVRLSGPHMARARAADRERPAETRDETRALQARSHDQAKAAARATHASRPAGPGAAIEGAASRHSLRAVSGAK